MNVSFQIHEKHNVSHSKSFSDLAKLVSRVERPRKPLKFITPLPEGYESSEEEGGVSSQRHRSGSLGDHEDLLGQEGGGNFGMMFSSTDEADYEVGGIWNNSFPEM